LNCYFASLHYSCNFIFSCKSLSPVGRVSVGYWLQDILFINSSFFSLVQT
jgi:hypothetical protein